MRPVALGAFSVLVAFYGWDLLINTIGFLFGLRLLSREALVIAKQALHFSGPPLALAGVWAITAPSRHRLSSWALVGASVVWTGWEAWTGWLAAAPATLQWPYGDLVRMAILWAGLDAVRSTSRWARAAAVIVGVGGTALSILFAAIDTGEDTPATLIIGLAAIAEHGVAWVAGVVTLLAIVRLGMR